MNVAKTQRRAELLLEPFDPRYAAEIASWVEDEEQLRWVAPSTTGSLTAQTVTSWTKPGGRAFVLGSVAAARPVGYGELNPMRAEPDHIWLGHIIVRPDQRGRGTGQALVRALLEHAFLQLFAKRVSLIVFPDNLAAIRCYRRAGFTIVGEEHHRFLEGGTRHRLLRMEIDSRRARRRFGRFFSRMESAGMS